MSIPNCGKNLERNEEYEKVYSVERFYKTLVNKNQPLIFDVGAHKGESINFFKRIYPKSLIYSFEPNPDTFKELTQNDAHSVRFIQQGLSDSIGFASYYSQTQSHLGGLNKVNIHSKDSLGYAKIAKNKEITVEINTLDNFCVNELIVAIDILKIDVQGLEASVLRGAQNILAKTSVVTVEVSLYDFYENTGSPFLEIEKVMNRTGLSLWDISHVSKNPKNLRTDWVELVYVNKNLNI